jgi:hypothetical protein
MSEVVGISPFQKRNLADQIRAHPPTLCHLLFRQGLTKPRSMIFWEVGKGTPTRQTSFEQWNQIRSYSGDKAVFDLPAYRSFFFS